MSKRFKRRYRDTQERCPMCMIRLNMAGAYCSRVCMDSADAAYKRDMERTRTVD